ncbi:hypothetical protein SOVF_154120 [Spinacia oleracea]|nr:hypothetical protein SOVF_154120 [Spinacia oleracea]
MEEKDAEMALKTQKLKKGKYIFQMISFFTASFHVNPSNP